MENISKATQKNWDKLNIDESKKKLEHRANKRMSTKRIIPKELFKNKNNIKIIKGYLEYINDNYDSSNIKKIMRSFCIRWLIENNLLTESLDTEKKNVIEFLKENNDIYLDIFKFKLPIDEDNILGIIYQCLQNEGEKNKQGSYYTPVQIVKDMVSNIKVENNTKILDPCCGTGIFLIESGIENPENLWGIDIDEISIMIAKVNLFIKYKEKDFSPNLYVRDFLDEKEFDFITGNFDYVITNPPWGADTSYISEVLYREIRSKESFSYMIVKSKRYLKPNGKIIFLLPESFLNVKIHCDIREYLIKMMSLKKIILYPSSFSGVLTKFISIIAENLIEDNYEIEMKDLDKNIIYLNNKKEVENQPNFVISKYSKEDKEILKKIFSIDYTSLKNSIWALGIVTGDNAGKLKNMELPNYEPIFTGKDILEYRLMPAKYFIKYDRNNFQQVAPDRIYRADEKLVYKFISKNITFAYDDKKSLFLNSANILIPNIENMSIKTCMAFLNSNLFKYIYIKMFGEIKILKGNLEMLPFPKISDEDNKYFEQLVDSVINGNDETKKDINQKVYEVFGLNEKEIEYVDKII